MMRTPKRARYEAAFVARRNQRMLASLVRQAIGAYLVFKHRFRYASDPQYKLWWDLNKLPMPYQCRCVF